MLMPRFIKPKVKIALDRRTTASLDVDRGPLPTDLLSDLPWVADLDPSNPAERVRLKQILRASRVKGQTFLVRRLTESGGKPLASFNNFPTSDEISAAVVGRHGGGQFNVFSTKPPQLLRTFLVDGPTKRSAKEHPQQPDRMTELVEDIRFDSVELAYQHLQDHPEVFHQFALGVLCSELDIPVPEMPNFDEQILNEALRDPEYRRREGERILESRMLKAEQKLDSMKLDYLLAYLKKVDRMTELLGWKRGGKANAGSEVAEAIKEIVANGGLKDILEVFKNVRKRRNPAQGRQASTDGEPRPDGRNQAGKGPPVAEHWSGPNEQVEEDQPPIAEPQPPSSEEPRVKKNPASGMGPQRVDVGVPAEELGLLGLGGDTTFVDWPLV